MKLSDFKGEEAILVMADLLDPITQILGDEKTKNFYDEYMKAPKKIPLDFARFLLKNHSTNVMRMFGILNKINVDDPAEFMEYQSSVNAVTVLKDLITLIGDEEIMNLFSSQGLSKEKTSSISVTEITEA